MYEVNLHLTSLEYRGNSGKFMVPDSFFADTKDKTIAESVADLLWNIGGYTILDITVEFKDINTAYINVYVIT